MTATEILLRWIETALARSASGRVVFRSSDIQMRPRRMGKELYDELYSPNNFIRRFRELRSDHTDKLRARGIADISEVPSDSRESLWQATAQPNTILTDHSVEQHA